MSNTNSNPRKSFKVVIVGDGKVGKTKLINQFIKGEFEKHYFPTLSAEVYPIDFSTNKGDITLDIWDTAGHEKLSGLRDGYYLGANAAIIMFDVTAAATYKNVPQWWRDIDRLCHGIPIVLCGNKVDIKEQAVRPRQIVFHRKKHLAYYGISANAHYKIQEPLLFIARALMGDQNLEFENLSLSTPEILMSEADVQAFESEMEAMVSAPTEASDDDL